MSLAAIATYLAIALLRVGHPFELQWIEGATADQVRRVLAGQPLYIAPSVDFVGLPYPPLYPWVASLVARVTGAGFLPLRLVSLTASVGSMVVLVAMVWRETRDRVAAVAAAGLFAAAFRLTGAWYDVGRVDSLFLFLLLMGAAVAHQTKTRSGGLASGVILALAFLTKQSAIVAVAPLALFMLVQRRRAGIALVAAFAIPVVVSTVALDLASAGWYRFFLAGSLASHDVETPALSAFWTDNLAPLVVVPILAVSAALVAFRGQRDQGGGVWLSTVAGLVATSWISLLHSGGYSNVLMPAVAGAALLFGPAVHHLRRGPKWRRTVAVLAVVVQFALLGYDPRAQLPTATDRLAGQRLVAAIGAVPGEIFVVSHPWYAVMAGKAATAHAAAIGDLVRGDSQRGGELTRASLAGAVRSQRFAAIVFDGTSEDRRGFPSDFERWYRPVPDPVFRAGSPGLLPVTDLKTRPRSWWVPRLPPPEL